MKKVKAKIILLLFFILSLFITPSFVLGYDTKTHAFLMDVIVDFYNKNFPEKVIDNDLKTYLIEGAVREDDPPRWMNHFYDPIYKRGLSYDPKIDFLNLGNWESSKEWAKDEKNQSSLIYKAKNVLSFMLSAFEMQKLKEETNFTWQKALSYYSEGKIKEAFFALGHIIHLIQDASVPDHTRNDPHYEGSPFEIWCSQFTLNTPDTSLKNKLVGKKPIILNNLDDYFDSLALYSNNNFFSKDTIGIQSGYSLPQVDLANSFVKNSKYYILHRDFENNEYPVLVKNSLSGSILGIKDISFSINDNLILSSYWNLLSQKAVIYGAGVINLFLKEGEKLSQEKRIQSSASLISSLSSLEKEKNVLQENETIKKENKPPLVYLNKTVLNPGESLILNGINFTPQGVALVAIEGNSFSKTFNLGVSKDGSWSMAYETPSDLKEGNYNFYARDLSTGLLTSKITFSVLKNIKVVSTSSSKESEISLSKVEESKNDSKNTSNVKTSQENKKSCSFNESLSPSYSPIIINEVAWMGGSEKYGLNSSDEWIELKNLTGNAIDLEGYELLSKRGNIKIVFPSGTKINAYGYFLLERTDDNSVPNIPADFIYTGGISNSDDGLELFDSNCRLLDKVIADPDWPAGDASLRRTMERRENLSWYTSGSFNGAIFGTPKFPNGGEYIENKNQSTVVYVGGGSSNTSINNSSNSQTPQLIINEVMYDYPGSDSGYEWIEVKNVGNTPFDVSSLKFFENNVSHSITKVMGENVIDAGGFFVIANGTSTFLSQYKDFNGNLFYSSFSLSNSGEEIALRYGNQIFGNIVYDTNLGAKGNGMSLQLINNEWKEAVPTPGRENVLNKLNLENSSNQNQNSESVFGVSSRHLVISEVKLEGEDSGDEFIEIYNPTENDINLEGFSIQYISGSASEMGGNSIYKKNFEKGNIIKANRFFLIARGLDSSLKDGYKGKKSPDLTYRSFNLSSSGNGGAIFLVSTTSLINSFNDENIVSSLFYGNGNIFISNGIKTAPVPPRGSSLQRKAFKEGRCISGLEGEEGEFLPKSCLTGESDTEFEINEKPKPQNFQSLAEPRSKPTSITPLDGRNSIAVYRYDDMKIVFSWKASLDAENSPSGIVYKIFAVDEDGEKFLIATTSLLEFYYSLPEIGKFYKFVLYAYDRDGMPSSPLNLELGTPLFNNDPVIFKSLVLKDRSYGSHYSDNWYELGRGFNGTLKSLTLRGYAEDYKYPVNIILQEFEDENYSVLLNSFTLASGPIFETYVKNIKIENLNVELHPFSYYRLLTEHTYQNRSVILWGEMGRGRAMSNTYVYNVGRVESYYPFYPFMIMEGIKGEDVDINEPQRPTKPSFTSLDFDKAGLKLAIKWSTSTDLDSLDRNITYEINYTTYSDFRNDEWINVGQNNFYTLDLVFPHQYKIGIRAKDDTGLYSEESVIYWNFPPNFRPYVLSNSYNTASQSFVLPKNITLKNIKIYTTSFSTISRYPDTNPCFFKLEDVTGNTPNLISFADGPHAGYGCTGEVVFNFSSSPQLYAGRVYRWIFFIQMAYDDLPKATVRFYGRDENIVEGLFSGFDFKNAAFEVESVSGEVFNLENWHIVSNNLQNENDVLNQESNLENTNISSNENTSTPTSTFEVVSNDTTAKTVVLEVGNGSFNPTTFSVKQNSNVTLVLRSIDDSVHIFRFDDPSLYSIAIGVAPHGERVMQFTAPSPGTYQFHCDIPGHGDREVGTMIVTE